MFPKKYINELQNNIRRRVNSDSLIRSLLVVDPLPPLVKPEYEVDNGYYPTMIDSFLNPKSAKCNKVLVDIFPLQVESILGDDFLTKTNFEILNKHLSNLQKSIHEKEEKLFFSLVNFLLNRDNNFIEVLFNDIPNEILKVKKKIDYSNLLCTKFVINNTLFDDNLNKIKTHASYSNNYYFNSLYGVDLQLSKYLDKNIIIGLTDPEYLGVFSIRRDIEVHCIDILNFTAVEEIGMCIINNNGLAIGKIV